jgi:Reverse transcriptase (RNA-dependent DNA polymerase)
MILNKHYEYGFINWFLLYLHLGSKPLNRILYFLLVVIPPQSMVLIHVDDIIITGSNPTLVTALISSLASQVSLKDLGPVHFFLGIQVTPQTDGIHLSTIHLSTTFEILFALKWMVLNFALLPSPKEILSLNLMVTPWTTLTCIEA